MEGGARRLAGTPSPPFFFLLSGLGGAAITFASVPSATGGTGVVLESRDGSASSGGGTDGEGSGLMGVDTDEAGKRASWTGDNRSVMILLLGAVLRVDLVVVGVDMMMVDSGRMGGMATRPWLRRTSGFSAWQAGWCVTSIGGSAGDVQLGRVMFISRRVMVMERVGGWRERWGWKKDGGGEGGGDSRHDGGVRLLAASCLIVSAARARSNVLSY